MLTEAFQGSEDHIIPWDQIGNLNGREGLLAVPSGYITER
jgi:hypothetical protein